MSAKMSARTRKAPTVAAEGAGERNEGKTQPIVARPPRRRQCGGAAPVSEENPTQLLPTLGSLTIAEDFSSDEDPSILRYDMNVQVGQMLADHAGSVCSSALAKILPNADPIDMAFLVRAIDRWLSDEGADCIQPGTLVSAILREAGFDTFNDEESEKSSRQRAFTRARERLTAAGVPFREE